MAEAGADAGHEGGFGRRGRGRRGRRMGGDDAKDGEGRRGGRGGRRGRRGAGGDKDGEPWVPCTKLGRLVQANVIKTLEEIYTHSLAIKEYQIVDFLCKDLKDEVMKITPVQKQTSAGQRTKFKAWVIVGDSNGHLGLGVKCAKEVAGAIRGAMIDAKLNVSPIRRGYWSVQKFGAPHTVPCKLTGKCGSVRARLVPAPKGTGLVAGKVAKKVLTKAGIIDCYMQTKGATKTLGNNVYATYNALLAAYGYLTPDLWKQDALPASLYATHSALLSQKKKAAPKEDRPRRGGFNRDREDRRPPRAAQEAAPAPAAEAPVAAN